MQYLELKDKIESTVNYFFDRSLTDASVPYHRSIRFAYEANRYLVVKIDTARRRRRRGGVRCHQYEIAILCMIIEWRIGENNGNEILTRVDIIYHGGVMNICSRPLPLWDAFDYLSTRKLTEEKNLRYTERWRCESVHEQSEPRYIDKFTG